MFWVSNISCGVTGYRWLPKKDLSFFLCTILNLWTINTSHTHLISIVQVTMALVIGADSGSKSSSSPDRRTSISGSGRRFFLLKDRYLTLTFCKRLSSALPLRRLFDGLLYIKKLSVTQNINNWKTLKNKYHFHQRNR